ncbi:ATP-binding cassette domain-containing protein [Flavobacteriaceae bacterium]|nr:ATP-binding cassette domain-containing protein [Flavobacteriaceae bacterium]
MSLKLVDINKSFKDQEVLQEITLDFPEYGCIGLLGPNGAGKSTLMKLILGLYEPDKGEIIGFDKNTSGYLSEQNPLYLEMYTRAYLKFHAEIRKVPFERIEELCDLLEIQERERGKKLKSLSKGYKQRVGLVAALLHKPKVLILDEPTTGLDPNQLQVFRKVIKSYSKEHLVILSSHIMQEVEAVCNQVVFIKNGSIKGRLDLTKLDREDLLVEISFDYRVEERFFKVLQGFVSVENTYDRTYELTLENKDQNWFEILQKFSAEQGLKILNFQIKKRGLESMFNELLKD